MLFLNIMMVHHHMEIAQIERWQIVSSLVHSSLVVHCRYRLKFLTLKVTRGTASYPIAVFLESLGLIMFNHHDDRLSHHSQPPHGINSMSIDILL